MLHYKTKISFACSWLAFKKHYLQPETDKQLFA